MFGLFKRDKAKRRAAGRGTADARQGAGVGAGALPKPPIDGTPDPAIMEKAMRALETGSARAKLRQTVKSAEDRDAAAAIRRMMAGDG